MKQWIGSIVCIAVLCTLAWSASQTLRPVPEDLPDIQRDDSGVVQCTWNWAEAMQPVAKRGSGKEGRILLIGDSLTYANQSTRWARMGSGAPGATESDKAILEWSHANKGASDLNGWHLASVDRVPGQAVRSETAASGIRTDQYLKGGYRGMDSLDALIRKHNPQVAIVLLGTNDVNAGRDPKDILADMNTIIEKLLANGTIPVLTTIPPLKNDTRHKAAREVNDLYLRLAKARLIPVIDLYGEMVARQPDGQWQGTLVGPDGVHLTHDKAGEAPTEENLRICGYLLRCWLTVQELKDVKAKVIDPARGDGDGNDAPTPPGDDPSAPPRRRRPRGFTPPPLGGGTENETSSETP